MDKELFVDSEKIQSSVRLTRAIGTMYRRHGRIAGRTCGQCKHLIREECCENRYFYKCKLYALTSSTATDFRKSFPACGKFEENK